MSFQQNQQGAGDQDEKSDDDNNHLRAQANNADLTRRALSLDTRNLRITGNQQLMLTEDEARLILLQRRQQERVLQQQLEDRQLQQQLQEQRLQRQLQEHQLQQQLQELQELQLQNSLQQRQLQNRRALLDEASRVSSASLISRQNRQFSHPISASSISTPTNSSPLASLLNDGSLASDSLSRLAGTGLRGLSNISAGVSSLSAATRMPSASTSVLNRDSAVLNQILAGGGVGLAAGSLASGNAQASRIQRSLLTDTSLSASSNPASSAAASSIFVAVAGTSLGGAVAGSLSGAAQNATVAAQAPAAAASNSQGGQREEMGDAEYYELFGFNDKDGVKTINETFPQKLYRMLFEVEQKGQQEIVSFLPHGKAFLVHQPKRFVEEVMPKYFSTNRMSSFQRQLNLYGFQRIDEGPEKGGFRHQHFQKGERSLCNLIRRQQPAKSQAAAAAAPPAPSVSVTGVPIPAVAASNPIMGVGGQATVGTWRRGSIESQASASAAAAAVAAGGLAAAVPGVGAATAGGAALPAAAGMAQDQASLAQNSQEHAILRHFLLRQIQQEQERRQNPGHDQQQGR